jgi:hypothetical protein
MVNVIIIIFKTILKIFPSDIKFKNFNEVVQNPSFAYPSNVEMISSLFKIAISQNPELRNYVE